MLDGNKPFSMAEPALVRPSGTSFEIKGEVGRRLDAVTQQWLLSVVHANPRILEMFRERDLQPYADQVYFAGEFAGKYLTSSTQILRLTGDAKLRRHLEWFVNELARLQAEDGYLGPWPKPWQLKRGNPACREPYVPADAWGHYHIMLGLLLWHELTEDTCALTCARRIADLLVKRFLHGAEQLHDTGSHDMNLAPIHTLAMLYRLVGEKDYLALARKILDEFAIPPAGDYYRQGLANIPFYKTPRPRWESLHPIMGLVELYYATGDTTYRQSFENLWWSMLEGDRHNNGGFTSGERARGNPYHDGPIETCATVAWTAMTVEMLRLTGNSIVADELELTLLNSGLGMISPSGRWTTYNTPMDGVREASAHSLVCHSRPGSSELNCCSVNGPRVLGLLGDWALMLGNSGDYHLNYYGPGAMETALPSGQTLRLTQDTQYPLKGLIKIALNLNEPETFTLALRIPAWSKQTSITVNGKPLTIPEAGSYRHIKREWRPGDRVMLKLDMSTHCWANPKEVYPLLERDWTVFGPIPSSSKENTCPPNPVIEPVLDTWQDIPNVIVANGVQYHGRTMRFIAGVLHIPEKTPPPTLIAATQWDADESGEIRISFSADWWTKWWVNGHAVYSTFEKGNVFSLDQQPHAHSFVAPVRKGHNSIALQLAGGNARGCWITIRAIGLQGMLSPPLIRYASLYRGPLLLSYDPAFNGGNAALLPGLDANNLKLESGYTHRGWLSPQLLLRIRNREGHDVQLCDFASAGLSGTRYVTWLPMQFPLSPNTDFTRTNPLRSTRLAWHNP